MRFWATALVLALTGLASPAWASACTLPPGWSKVVTARAHFVVFGEMHGSAEAPARFGDAACALAERRERVLVAVELDGNAGLERAWSAPHARFAAMLAAEMPEWNTRNDGVTSRAMFDLLVRLHALKAAGRAIDVVAFNDTTVLEDTRFKDLPGQGPHEAGQAENIRAADALRPHDRVLVLVGNYHARKRPIAPGGTTYEPMAMRLADPDRIVSLYLAQAGGQLWNCQLKGPLPAAGKITPSMIDCAAHSTKGDVAWHGVSRIVPMRGRAGPANPGGAFDATYLLGPVTASPPALASR